MAFAITSRLPALGCGRGAVGLPALLGLALLLSGCRTAHFYAQAVSGQLSLLNRGQAIHKLLARPDLDPALRQRLLLVQSLRRFAEKELGMEVDGLYTSYADLGRPFVVWNITATPEFSMAPKRWCYPVVGRLDYRGYFKEESAVRYAAYLRNQGLDVEVGGVTAYSTLGWFNDPVLNTFLFDPEPDLAETLFHELAHQMVFAGGDTDFNEAFATAVGQEGTRRWLSRGGEGGTGGGGRGGAGGEDLHAGYVAELAQDRRFVRLVEATRRELEQLYGDTRDETGRLKARKGGPHQTHGRLRQEKLRILGRLRENYSALEWTGERSREAWIQEPLNNAKLNSIATYYELLPGFEALLQQQGLDLPAFYAAAGKLARLPAKQRRDALRTLAGLSVSGAPQRSPGD